MMTFVLAGLLLVLIVLTVYPYLVYPLILRALPKTPLAPPDPAAANRFALLFCAHNEARALPETIANLRRLKAAWPELAIYAYSDNSSDDTYALLAGASDILTAVEGTARAGKPAGMRKLVALGEEEVLIFMDANVLIDPATARRFETYFARPDVGAVACTLTYVNEDESVSAEVGGLYWRMEEALKRLESETGSTMGADGSLFALRRSLYPSVRPDLQDDFLASMQAVFAGLRCVSAPDIAASERGATQLSDEFRRKRRIACGAFSTHRAMLPQLRRLSALNRFKYLSHKLVRWFGVFYVALGALVAAALAAQLGLFLPFLALVAAGTLAAVTLLALGFGPVRKLYEVLVAMLATGIGVLESLFGVKYVTWTPVER